MKNVALAREKALPQSAAALDDIVGRAAGLETFDGAAFSER
jgi:hypothetical protein